MTYDNFTVNAQEAILKAQQLAGAMDQQVVDTAHILKGIMETDPKLSEFLCNKAGISVPALQKSIQAEIEKIARVSGSDKQYLSNDANKALSKAKTLAKELGDEFIALEILLLAILEGSDSMAMQMKSGEEHRHNSEKLFKSYAKADRSMTSTQKASTML